MTDADRKIIAKKELGSTSKYEYIVFSDSEYNNLPFEKEEELDSEYEIICKSNFVLYFKAKQYKRTNL